MQNEKIKNSNFSRVGKFFVNGFTLKLFSSLFFHCEKKKKTERGGITIDEKLVKNSTKNRREINFGWEKGRKNLEQTKQKLGKQELFLSLRFQHVLVCFPP